MGHTVFLNYGNKCKLKVSTASQPNIYLTNKNPWNIPLYSVIYVSYSSLMCMCESQIKSFFAASI